MRGTAIVALEPGEFDAQYCTVWVTHRKFGQIVMQPRDTCVRTDDPAKRTKVVGAADAILSDSGFRRAGDWVRVRYSLQAPVKR